MIHELGKTHIVMLMAYYLFGSASRLERKKSLDRHILEGDLTHMSKGVLFFLVVAAYYRKGGERWPFFLSLQW